MAQYIDKDALVVEIEKILDKLYNLLPDASKVEKGMITISEACSTGKYTALESFKDYIDTLEVKDVDLEKEVELWMQGKPNVNFEWGNVADAMRDCAKHFFELGLSVNNSTKVTAPHRTKAGVDVAMAEIEEKSKAFTEAHKGETTEEILAQMRGEEPVSATTCIKED